MAAALSAESDRQIPFMRLPSRLLPKLVLALLAAAVAVWPQVASAAPAPPMVVSVHRASGAISSYFDFAARPGRAATAGTLELRNQTARRVTVLLDPVDAVTATTLGSAYQVRGTPIHGPTRWTSLPRRTVVLAPRASTTIRIVVRLPRGVAPGDYLSGIGVQALGGANQAKLRGNVAISSVERYAVGVVVRVPGPRHPLIRLTSAAVERNPAGVTFLVRGRNPGNAILQNIQGWILVTQGKRTVARIPVGPGTFVTGTSIAYPVPTLREQPKEGTVYRVRALFRYSGGRAYLDTLVRFGHGAAVRQETYGGPKAPRSGGSALLFILIAVALLALLGSAGVLWHRRRPVSVQSAIRSLDRALADARDRSEPLSIIRISSTNGEPRDRSLPALVRERLRRSDRLHHVNGHELLVVAPDTSAEAAGVLAAELRRRIDREDVSPPVSIDVITPNGEGTAADLLNGATKANGASAAPHPDA